MVNAYIEERKINIIQRTFSKDVDPFELKWHWDEKDRIVEIISGDNWKFQYDNQLPFMLEEGIKLEIPEGMYHRIFKGTTDLVVKIYEKD
jgi:hypothetical protein